MDKLCSVTVNGADFLAYPGDVLLDAALVNGVEIPHDCRSGRCGSCLVRVGSGHVVGGESSQPGAVHACQARILSDLTLAFDDVPAVASVAGEVAEINDLAADVVELAIAPRRPLEVLPGQYLQVEMRGYPARPYSPTARLDAAPSAGLVRFHVKRLPGGRVSSALGTEIVPGHRVKLSGPFGSAHFRRGLPNRLVLVAGGTGFAPIWAIADAALQEWAGRPLVIVAGARSVHSLYMLEALDLMRACPGVSIVIATEEPQSITPLIGLGSPADFLPPLSSHDVVYAAGPPRLVEAVGMAAQRAGAMLHADPFNPAPPAEDGPWLGRLLSRASEASLPGQLTPGLAQRIAQTLGRS